MNQSRLIVENYLRKVSMSADITVSTQFSRVTDFFSSPFLISHEVSGDQTFFSPAQFHLFVKLYCFPLLCTLLY